jgi:hypothetical protein
MRVVKGLRRNRYNLTIGMIPIILIGSPFTNAQANTASSYFRARFSAIAIWSFRKSANSIPWALSAFG